MLVYSAFFYIIALITIKYAQFFYFGRFTYFLVSHVRKTFTKLIY